MLDVVHKTSAWSLAVNAAWVWLGNNANSITAACAIIGLAVNLWCSWAKYRNGKK